MDLLSKFVCIKAIETHVRLSRCLILGVLKNYNLFSTIFFAFILLNILQGLPDFGAV